MLPGKNRLHLQRDIERVRKTGRTVRGELFTLRFLSGQSKVSRFCFVTSKQASKKAVERNLITRWARESVQQYIPSIEEGPFDVVVYAQRGFSSYSFEACVEEISSLLKRANIVK